MLECEQVKLILQTINKDNKWGKGGFAHTAVQEGDKNKWQK